MMKIIDKRKVNAMRLSEASTGSVFTIAGMDDIYIKMYKAVDEYNVFNLTQSRCCTIPENKIVTLVKHELTIFD